MQKKNNTLLDGKDNLSDLWEDRRRQPRRKSLCASGSASSQTATGASIGKEFDEETGMYYYGARYYEPRLSLWMGVDSKAQKFPNVSSYAYCLNNPIVYNDPNGDVPVLALVLKAGTNAAADWFLQTAMNYYFNPATSGNLKASASDVNGWQVFRSGCEGLIPWKTPGGRLGRAALSAIGDVVVNFADKPSSYTTEDALRDFSIGFIGDLAGGGLGELVSKYGTKAVAKGLSKLGFDLNNIENLMPGTVKWSSGKTGSSVEKCNFALE